MKERAAAILVAASAVAIAIVSARDYAGSWNDGSRLATVESLVDRHTLRIDDSIFVRVPNAHDPRRPGPYRLQDVDLVQRGTQDKLLIDGHFYSDKSPVPAVLLAGLYQVLQWSTGLTAQERPDRFCYGMTLGSSGVAYVVAVCCIFQLAGWLRLPLALRLTLTASFSLATVAPTYARHVNNHILLLGVAAAVLLVLMSLAEEPSAERTMTLGTLAGLGYGIDLGAGPLLFVCTLALVAYRGRSWRTVALYVIAALPWLLLHHALNYGVGGTFRPANAVQEYFTWPGAPFSAQNLTGAWHHTPGHFLIYATALLIGKRGFLGHNLPLLLAMPGVVVLLVRRIPELPEVLWAGAWSAGTWLVYALTSNNYSGECTSIRWFVPLLAPGYLVLALFLRERPRHQGDFVVLSAWGALLAALMWSRGPWMKHMVPFFWPLQAFALGSWALIWARRRRESVRA